MLYGNESIAYFKPSNIAIWMAMAFQAGVINAGAFLVCHRFVSHVTGFATYFGYELNRSNFHSAWGLLVVPFAFLIGCIISGALVDIRLKLHKTPKYYLSFGLIFFLVSIVAVLGIGGFWGPFGGALENSQNFVLLIILSLICGIQNATITAVSNSVIRTTHLTGVTTDLGIALARLAYRKRINIDVENETNGILMRIGIILFFVLGSVVGVFLFMHFQYWGFLTPVFTSGILFILMLYYQLKWNSLRK